MAASWQPRGARPQGFQPRDEHSLGPVPAKCAEEIRLKQASGPEGIVFVRLTRSHPQGARLHQKEASGSNRAHEKPPRPVHMSTRSPIHSSHCGRPPCAQSEKLVPGQAEVGPAAAASPGRVLQTQQQKQEAGPCGYCYTSPAPTPEVTKNLCVTTGRRGLQASSGPPLQTPTGHSSLHASELKGQLSHPHLAPPLNYVPRLQAPGSACF